MSERCEGSSVTLVNTAMSLLSAFSMLATLSVEVQSEDLLRSSLHGQTVGGYEVEVRDVAREVTWYRMKCES